MVGSFIGFGALKLLGGSTDPKVPTWLLLVLITLAAMAGCAVLGVTIERFAYRPLRNAPRIAPLISALGVSFFLAYSMQLMFGSEQRDYDAFSPFRRGALLQRLRHRQRARAIAQDRDHRLGLPADDRALAPRDEDAHRHGDASDLLRPRGGVDDGHRRRPRDRVRFRARLGARGSGGSDVRARAPTDVAIGFLAGLKGFTAAVIGGIGSIPGAMAGGLILGFAEAFTQGLHLDALVRPARCS
jgi:branched-chain amino acid transport system permease protein